MRCALIGVYGVFLPVASAGRVVTEGVWYGTHIRVGALASRSLIRLYPGLDSAS